MSRLSGIGASSDPMDYSPATESLQESLVQDLNIRELLYAHCRPVYDARKCRSRQISITDAQCSDCFRKQTHLA